MKCLEYENIHIPKIWEFMVEGKRAFLFLKGRYHNRTYRIYLECCIGLCNNKLWIGFIWIRDHGEVPRDQYQSQIKDQQVWNKILIWLEKVLTGKTLLNLGLISGALQHSIEVHRCLIVIATPCFFNYCYN